MTRYLIEFRFLGETKHELKTLIWQVDRIFRIGHAKRHRPVPHVTLVGPLYTRDERRLIFDFEELCSKQPIMTFNVKGFGTFEDTRVVFIKIEPDETLDKFRWELSQKLKHYCDLGPYDLSRKFNFHATIAMRLHPDKFNEVIDFIKTLPEPKFTYCVMRVTLLKKQKILREYDFFLRRSLSRREAKSRRILSESFQILEKYLEQNKSIDANVRPLIPAEETREIRADDLIGGIFFISDLHLDHANIIKYCNRPFKSVDEMNRCIVNNWNETVGKNDTVFFLGDMSYGRGSRKTSYWLDKLNGNIFFIKGYHDRSKKIKFYDKLILNHQGRKFLLIHDPQKVPSDWKGWVIHGHAHNNDPKHPLINLENRTINVSAELLNYKPISLEELLMKLDLKNTCHHCGRVIQELPYRCSYCGSFFCADHCLPEAHECRKLERSWSTYKKGRERQEPVKPP